MKTIRIIIVVTLIGLVYSTPVQNDGIKSGSSSGVKGHDAATKYSFEDHSGQSKISSPGQIVRVQSGGSVGWQSHPVDVSPSQVEPSQEGQYVPVINVKPETKVDWITPVIKKQYSSDEVLEQRKEEPVFVSSYEPTVGSQVSRDVYRDILPEVLTGKRRLGEEDVIVSSHSEGGSIPDNVKVIPNVVGSVKVPVKQYVYGDRNVPHHIYTENTFPSLISLKGRQYLIVPHKTGDQIQPYFTSSTVRYPFSWEAHSDYVPGDLDSHQVYQSIPIGVSHDVPSYHEQVVKGHYAQGLVPVVPVSQTLTGQSAHTLPTPTVVRQQQAPAPTTTLDSNSGLLLPPSSSSSTTINRPHSVVSTSIQSDLQFASPIGQKVPHFSPYYYVYQPSTYSKFYSSQFPSTSSPKTQTFIQSPITQSSWGFISAPQYTNKYFVRPSRWVIKGVRKSEVGEIPVPEVKGGVVGEGIKTWVGSVDSDQKTKWYVPSVEQTGGKSWYIYTPISGAPWSYGVSKPSYGAVQSIPSVSTWVPQYAGQWDVPEDGKIVASSQWPAAPLTNEQWSVKSRQQTVTSQGVSYVPSFTQKVKSVPIVPGTAPGNQASKTGADGSLHYSVEINHGSSSSEAVQQAPHTQVVSGAEKYNSEAQSNVQVHPSIHHNS